MWICLLGPSLTLLSDPLCELTTISQRGQFRQMLQKFPRACPELPKGAGVCHLGSVSDQSRIWIIG